MPQLHTVRELLLTRHALWSPGVPSVTHLWGLPIVPCVQLGATRPVRSLVGDNALTVEDASEVCAVWAWTKPGDTRAVDTYAGRCIADVETGRNGWTGAASETVDAHTLAARVAAVTSHGFVLRKAKRALLEFARVGCIAIPQVYDRDASADPQDFVKRCVSMYRDLGFADVVPLLGVDVAKVGGAKHLRLWAAACEEQRCNFHVWAYGTVLDSSAAVKAWAKELGAANVRVDMEPVTEHAADLVAQNAAFKREAP